MSKNITDLIKDPVTGVFLPGNNAHKPGQAGTIRGRQRLLWELAKRIAGESEELKRLKLDGPQDVLLYVAMTGKWPGIQDIRDVALDKDSEEYRKVIKANPWIVSGIASETARLTALSTILTFLMPKLSQVAFKGDDEANEGPTDEWARMAAADPVLRDRIEAIIMGQALPPGPDPSQPEMNSE